MNLLLHTTGSDPHPWLAAFQEALPQAQIRIWQQEDNAPADYALVWKPPAEMLRQRTELKAIFALGAGVDALLQLGDELPVGVPIIRVDDAGMGIQMAEYVVHAVLRYFRRFDQYGSDARRVLWQPQAPQSKADFGVGILGLGVLGQCIAQQLQPFGFPLQGWSASAKEIPHVKSFVGEASLPAFLAASKVLVCALPLTPQTQNIIDRHVLAQLPHGAYVINVARGGHVVDADLLEMIAQGHIAGATLDVFRQEPLPPEHPFWREPRISITPHISAITLRDESVQQIAAKIQAIEHGQPIATIAGLVDQHRGY